MSPIRRPALLLGLAWLAMSCVLPTSAVATSTAPTTPAPCPVTVPNGSHPPDARDQFTPPGVHGKDPLWTNVWNWGEGIVPLPPELFRPDGSTYGVKWPWWRGIEGELMISGKRLDADAPPLTAEIPDGYGPTGFQPVGLLFPSVGCWEVTGSLGNSSLTFVVQVVRTNAAGTPEAKATPLPR